MFSLFKNLFDKRSYNWSKVRKEHLKKYPECAACGRKDDLEVHHIVPVSVNPDRELDPSNLITLCGKYCHFIFGHFMDWKSWNPNIHIDAESYRRKVDTRPKK